MKKILSLLLLLILMISGVGTSFYFEKTKINLKLKNYSESILFSEPLIKERSNHLFINVDGIDSYFHVPGKPILPVVIKKYVFPLGTTIKDVRVTFSTIKEYKLYKEISITPLPVTTFKKVKAIVGENVYGALYPEKRFDYSIHVGIEGKTRVVILKVMCFPVQYNYEKNIIYFAKKSDINIIYELPKKPIAFPDKYDMVIIAPRKFSADLQPLIDYKNSHGIRTILKTTESIYREYSGRDGAEKVKYFIKDAIENWDISYVLLVGGKKSILFGNWGMDGPYLSNDELWYVPVRYNALFDSLGEKGCLTDLYFADIYKYENGQPVFDDWDSDGNGVFAEWNLDAKDTLDLYPDVYVGRLPCRNTFEVKIIVNKIMEYEKQKADSSWFKKIVGVGGDSFDDRPPLGNDYFEGEERNKVAFQYLSDFTPVKIWASHRGTGEPIPSAKYIIKAMNDGCGFIYFAGHGNPSSYMTFWYHQWHNYSDYPGSFSIYHMLALHNGNKLPICVIGTCHNSEFNISLFDFSKNPYLYIPTPECWSWVFTRKIGGGSIATIGYTGYEWVATYGWDDDDVPDCTQYFSGYIDSRFFYAYGVDGIDILGEDWGKAITDYVDKFPVMKNAWGCKTVQQWILLGDPSLKIGGY